MIITTQWDEILTEVAFFQGGMKIWLGQSVSMIIFLWLLYSFKKKSPSKKQEKAQNRKLKMIGTCPDCPN